MTPRTFGTFVEIRSTRFKELGYRQDQPGLWRIYDITSTDGVEYGRAVGPHYTSKAELLADLPRYASEFGCEGAPLPAIAPTVFPCVIDSMQELTGAINLLIQYNWNDELEDYIQHRSDGLTHIFTTLVALDNWANNRTATPQHYVDDAHRA